MARPLKKLTRDRKTIQEKTIVATEKKTKQNNLTNKKQTKTKNNNKTQTQQLHWVGGIKSSGLNRFCILK